ncbi:hypothetical protein D3C78_1686120 [compost metagenome]
MQLLQRLSCERVCLDQIEEPLLVMHVGRQWCDSHRSGNFVCVLKSLTSMAYSEVQNSFGALSLGLVMRLNPNRYH